MTLVREFHEKYGHPIADAPPLTVDKDLVRLRMRLLREEYQESMQELERLLVAETPEEILRCCRDLMKELSDLRYVADGAAVALGLPIDAAFEEVHRSNMTKGTEKRPDGKTLKGSDYEPADMEKLLPNIIDVGE